MQAPRRALVTLFVIVFIDLVGFGMVIPLLPLYAETYRPSPWLFGLLMSAYSAMQFLFSPLLGRLSDRFGRRPVLLLSLAGAVGGYLLLAASNSLVLLFASRLLAGAAGGNIATAQAVIADLTEAKDRARGMGLIGAAFGLGFIAGPAMASVLLGLGPAAPGLGAAFCSAVAMLMTFLLLPESLSADRRGGVRDRRWSLVPLVLARHRRELQPLLLIGFALVTGFAAFEVTFAQLVHTRFELPMRQVSLLFVYIGVLAAAVQGGLMGRLTRRFSEQRLLLAGLVLTAGGLTLVAAQHRISGLLVAMPVLALGMGLSSPSLSALVSRGAAAGEQGEAMGAFQGVGSLARVAGPFLGELSLGRFGPGSPALGAAALALLAALAAVTLLAPLPSVSG